MPTPPPLACIILAAGHGTRLKSALPKVMHRVMGQPMVARVVATLNQLAPTRQVVVIGPDMAAVAACVHPHPTVIQTDRLGTGHAARQAHPLLADITSGTVLVAFADNPLLTAPTVQRLIAARERHAAGVAVLAFTPSEPGAYGRVMVDADNHVTAIVEAHEATTAQLAVKLCNAGVMAFDAARLWDWLAQLTPQNAKGEYYLTDVVAIARAEGQAVVMVEGHPDEVVGVNSRAELAVAEALAQTAKRAEIMTAGVTLIDPASVFFSHDTRVGRDTEIAPFVTFGEGVSVGENVAVLGFCHLDHCTIADHARVGPYARLRPGTVIGPSAHIGNFVEIKNSSIAAHAKVNHLSYVGDATVGEKSNIGAGAITCNYDGFGKYRTIIGNGAFVGSNTSLVAPVSVGDGAIIAAGSVITADIPDHALAIARSRQAVRPAWAARFRARFLPKT